MTSKLHAMGSHADSLAAYGLIFIFGLAIGIGYDHDRQLAERSVWAQAAGSNPESTTGEVALGLVLKSQSWVCQGECEATYQGSTGPVECSSYAVYPQAAIYPCEPLGIRVGYKNHIQNYGSQHWTYVATTSRVAFSLLSGNKPYWVAVGNRYKQNSVNPDNYTGQRFFAIGSQIHFVTGDVGNEQYYGAEAYLSDSDSNVQGSVGYSSAHCATYGCANRRDWWWEAHWTEGSNISDLCPPAYERWYRRSEANTGEPGLGSDYQLTGLYVLVPPGFTAQDVRAATQYDRAWLTIVDVGYFVFQQLGGIIGLRRRVDYQDSKAVGFGCISNSCEGENAAEPAIAKFFNGSECSSDLCYGSVKDTPCCRSCDPISYGSGPRYRNRTLPLLWKLEFYGPVRDQVKWDSVVRNGIQEYAARLRSINDESSRHHGELLREATGAELPDIVVRIFENETVMQSMTPSEQLNMASNLYNHLHFQFDFDRTNILPCFSCCPGEVANNKPLKEGTGSSYVYISAASQMHPVFRWEFGSIQLTEVSNFLPVRLPARRMFLHEFGHALGLNEYNYANPNACQLQNADLEIMCQWSAFALCPGRNRQGCTASYWQKQSVAPMADHANVPLLRSALCSLHRGAR